MSPTGTDATASTTRLRVPMPDREALADLCRRWRITELAVFGSALRDDFRPDSDIDLLVTFGPDERWSLFDLVTIEDDFAALLGRTIDLIERSAIERSHNWIRRREILGTARVLYAEG